MLLTKDFVQAAIDAEKAGKAFPLDFDLIWVEAGYSTKSNAYRFLSESCKGLKLNNHYVYIRLEENPLGGRPVDKYYFSLEAAKFFLARSNTTQGDEALWSLIEIEKAYRAQLDRQFAAPVQPDWISEIGSQISALHMENEALKVEIKAVRANAQQLQQSRLERVAVPNSVDKCIPLKSASDVIGYAGGTAYVLKVLLQNFQHEKDYQLIGDGKNALLSEACFQELLIVARPQASAQRDRIPALIVIERDRFYRGTHGSQNQRFPS